MAFRLPALLAAAAIFFLLGATAISRAETFDPAIAKTGQYRNASFVVWCYGAGKASVGGEKGVHHVSMLVRDTPFREWVTVYFDPKQTSEDKLLSLLRERRCPKATLDRSPNDKFTVMNPYVGPGGIVQIKTTSPPDDPPPRVTLPEGWKMVGPETGVIDKQEGATYFSVQVPATTKPGTCSIGIRSPKLGILEASVEVVRCMDP